MADNLLYGKIIRGVAGFYYVNVENEGVFECRARGIFRNKREKPLPGDNVGIMPLVSEKRDGYPQGSMEKILVRKNEIIRPSAANIDQAMVVFALAWPDPNLNLLDRFLVMMDEQAIPCIIVFNKNDLVDESKTKGIIKAYADCGRKVLDVSTMNLNDREKHLTCLKGKTTLLAGPSGVGKSSIMNLINPDADTQTGTLSEKIGRGKNTTRHTEIFYVERGTYILDTPGFSSIYIDDIKPQDLRFYFEEFKAYTDKCRFNSCVHISEPDCAVKKAVSEGKISTIRYENYKQLYSEISVRRRGNNDSRR